MPIMQHHRLNERLREYWNSLLRSRPFPEEAEIDPDALADIWDSCFLVKDISSRTGKEGYRYDYLGKHLIDAFGGDITHQEVSAMLVDTASPPLVKAFATVIATGKPYEEEAEFTNAKGTLIKYRTCMFPLGNSRDGVQFILGGMKWKTY